ncbi:MAG TPA: SET domain-containing protein [Oligoflexia bacterium]|nr:SET domain-containing protein [Oligoflexia bacterium]HMR23951.1 SET domain-containing protein [Oligoflexia bacterium]
MLHPSIHIKWLNDEKGYGLFASSFIPKGTITWALDKMDKVYLAKQVQEMDNHYQQQIFKYGYRNAKGHYIVCWDLAKYMNHSCDPNTLSPGLKFDIAIKDIQAGEEITTDYSSLNLEETLNCACGIGHCREQIEDKDFETYVDDWDDKINQAFTQINKVPQKLWPWVEEQKILEQIQKKGGKIPSIIKHRYKEGLSL